VNPVLREGNSDRRAPLSVKNYARKHPHRMGAWASIEVARRAHGRRRLLRQREVGHPGQRRFAEDQLPRQDGSTIVLKEKTAVKAGEIIDAAVMSRKALAAFIGEQIADAKAQGVLFSLHLKATMMKVSDPIMFGVRQEFYKDVRQARRRAEAGRFRRQQRHR
jgi:isocitrate dehydrogenase